MFYLIKKLKKVCRYQQFWDRKDIKKSRKKITDGIRAGGLIWHTQGEW